MILFWSLITVMILLASVCLIWPLRAKQNYLTALLLSLFVGGVSLGLYFYFGNSTAVSEYLRADKRAIFVKNEIVKYGSRAKIILALRNKLDQLPLDKNNAKGWYLLGKLYFNEKNLAQALFSFQRAATLNPHEPDYVLQFVSVKFMMQHQLDDQDKQLIKQLLITSPNNLNAINLLALDAYQQKDFPSAIHYWEQLLNYFPAGSEDSKMLLAMIQRAHQNLKPATTIIVQTNIYLAPLLNKKLATSDVLFVYALEKNGSKMPLAVTRVPIAKFPMKVTLSSAQTMLPGKSLADVSEFYLIARISKSGNAMPVKGDLMGQSGVLSTKQNNHIDIQIAKEFN